jgi:2-succinyl-6-hydroxy-2,4-cyclohexadiene-1-carboxylate synthase
MDPDRAGLYPTVVFLHGFLGSGDVFLPLLKHTTIGMHPILIDLPGHGSTKYPNDPKRYQLPQQLHDLHSVIESCTNSPHFLYGYSMGGRLALRYALLFQGGLKGLILESTSHGIQGLGVARERVGQDAQRSAEILANFPLFLKSWNAHPMFVGGKPGPSNLEAYNTIQSQQDPIGVANSLIGFSAGLMPDVRVRLKHLQLPVLLLAGGYDPVYVRSAATMESLIPFSEKVVILTAAHRVHLDAPHLVADHLSTFISTYN